MLTRLSLAWSRDGTEKTYVQDRMRENGAELWKWLEGGAHFYVCGDAKRMAKDVERAIIDVAAQFGGQEPRGRGGLPRRAQEGRAVSGRRVLTAASTRCPAEELRRREKDPARGRAAGRRRHPTPPRSTAARILLPPENRPRGPP